MLREYNIFDERGEMLSSYVSRTPPKIKGRWFFMNCKDMMGMLAGFESLVSLKLLLFLASKMTYESSWVKISRAELSLKLGCSAASIDRAVADLTAKHVLFVGKVDGLVAFLLNPEVVSKGGKSRQAHLADWRAVQAQDGGDLAVVVKVDTETGEIVERGVAADEDFGTNQEEEVLHSQVLDSEV